MLITDATWAYQRDNYGYMRIMIYGHHGNGFREMGQPFWISAKGDALRGIKAGEKVRIDLSKGTFSRVLSNLKTKEKSRY